MPPKWFPPYVATSASAQRGVTFRTTVTATGAFTASITPSHAVAGDLLLVAVGNWDAGHTITGPAGWVKAIDATADNNLAFQAWTRTAIVGDATTAFVWTCSNDNIQAACIDMVANDANPLTILVSAHAAAAAGVFPGVASTFPPLLVCIAAQTGTAPVLTGTTSLSFTGGSGMQGGYFGANGSRYASGTATPAAFTSVGGSPTAMTISIG